MAKLVVLSEGFTGLSYELKAEKTSIGRVEDNAFAVPEPSVSSHHCEVLLRGEEVVVRDLSSTNGTFINGEPVKESVLKPGQVLRLGQLEIRLETGTAAAAGKKPLDKTIALPQGVRVQDFEQGGRTAVDTTVGFAKKSNKTNRIFIGIGIALGVVIIILLLLVYQRMS